MCGIFGVLSNQVSSVHELKSLANSSARRGKDSSGIVFFQDDAYHVVRLNQEVKYLFSHLRKVSTSVAFGHSRLVTQGMSDNQPILRDGIVVLHNGIVINTDELWNISQKTPQLEIDTEILNVLVRHFIDLKLSDEEIARSILKICVGVVNCCIFIPERGKLILLSNNGSLYQGVIDDRTFFASEKHFLSKMNASQIVRITPYYIYDVPKAIEIHETDFDISEKKLSLVPNLVSKSLESLLLDYPEIDMKKCKKCILPESMPFISFDDDGVCNFCSNYIRRNLPKPSIELDRILERYRRLEGEDCIIPFSGGRDSSFGLYLAKEEFGMKPIAYTYDWGMVTDLGRRNISLMCSKLGIENIIVAADIAWKRDNIRKNLIAWLKNPHLGMLSLLTAGDKHFFRYIEEIKQETGILLNIWSVNPLEVTHFKAGLLGVRPDFLADRVYQSGLIKQFNYQFKRFKIMFKNPLYLNSSLYDTLTGEFYRSRAKDENYVHLFDYWKWDENEIDGVLSTFGWEKAQDTKSTWRIGDGTAAFYNYIHHRVLGFSEHDTFRSNQIREGDISRGQALKLVREENLPRYENIRWYLDSLGLNFNEVIERINSIPRYRPNSNLPSNS